MLYVWVHIPVAQSWHPQHTCTYDTTTDECTNNQLQSKQSLFYPLLSACIYNISIFYLWRCGDTCFQYTFQKCFFENDTWQDASVIEIDMHSMLIVMPSIAHKWRKTDCSCYMYAVIWCQRQVYLHIGLLNRSGGRIRLWLCVCCVCACNVLLFQSRDCPAQTQGPCMQVLIVLHTPRVNACTCRLSFTFLISFSLYCIYMIWCCNSCRPAGITDFIYSDQN